MKTLTRLALVSFVLLAAATLPAKAATISNYTFTGNSLSSSDADASSTAGDFVIGSGFTGLTGFTNNGVNFPALLVESDHTPGTEADAISANDYFSFTVTPAAGGSFDFDTLNFNLVINNFSNAITQSIAVRWSVDSFATTLGTGTLSVGAGQSGVGGGGVNLGSFPAQNGPVEFRFYVFDDQNSVNSNVGIDSITLTGTDVPPPVPFVTTLVAAKGDPAPGMPSALLSIPGKPAVDSAGRVAFQALVSGTSKTAGVTKANNSGIWLYSGSTGTLLAQTGTNTTAPGTAGALFSTLSDPVMSGSGALAFLGKLAGGDTTKTNAAGVWVSKSGTTSLGVRLGDTAPTGNNFPGPLAYTSLNQIGINNAGGVTFLAGLAGLGGKTTGLFGTDASGNLEMLVAIGQGGNRTAPGFSGFIPLPFVAGQSRSLDTVNGNMTLFGPLNPPFLGTIGLALSGTGGFAETNVVNVGDATPDGNVFTLFNEPAVNAKGSVAFLSTISGAAITKANNAQVWLVTGGTNYNFVVATGSLAADADGNTNTVRFAKLSNPVLNNNDRIAVIGTLIIGGTSGVLAGTENGIWSNADGTGRQIVREGDIAPGTSGTGTFLAFNQIVLPDAGGVVMLATLAGVPKTASQGIWLTTQDRSLHLVARTGDVVDVRGVQKTISTLSIFPITLYSPGVSRSFDAATGNLVYTATFTDKSWAIFEATHP